MTPDRTSLVDIHSHLVPAVDDGVRSVPGALSAVERMTEAGIGRIITTPHFRGSVTLDRQRMEARLSEVSEAWSKAAEALKKHFPEVEYHRGHEILLDVPEIDLSDDRLRMAGTSFVLVEWPRLHIPPGTPRVLGRMREQGYRPVIAHPERYMGMSEQMDLATRWRAAGAYLQVNYGSIHGRYGTAARLAALELLEEGLVDYLASDFHGQTGMKVYRDEAWCVLEERGAFEVLEILCRVNPGRVLQDRDPLPVPAVPPSAKLMDRLRGMVRRRIRSTEWHRG